MPFYCGDKLLNYYSILFTYDKLIYTRSKYAWNKGLYSVFWRIWSILCIYILCNLFLCLLINCACQFLLIGFLIIFFVRFCVICVVGGIFKWVSLLIWSIRVFSCIALRHWFDSDWNCTNDWCLFVNWSRSVVCATPYFVVVWA